MPSSPFPHVQAYLKENVRQQLIEANRREYGHLYDLLTFADPEKLASAVAERKELLNWLEQRTRFGYAGTKVDCNSLSPGCRSCGDGGWSCLFINGRCNGRCFYCPTAQDDDGPPVTNGLAFTSPEDYAAYVAALGFSGVSISGGEPLLTPDLTLDYLRAVRKRCGDGLHLWLYTNGTLLTADLCSRLQDAGLNEIRFDLGAVRYNLKKLRLAVGCIPTVTVEIPAVPEDEGLLRLKMVEMAEVGCQPPQSAPDALDSLQLWAIDRAGLYLSPWREGHGTGVGTDSLADRAFRVGTEHPPAGKLLFIPLQTALSARCRTASSGTARLHPRRNRDGTRLSAYHIYNRCPLLRSCSPAESQLPPPL